MITVEQAKQFVEDNTKLLSVQKVKLDQALGYVLSEDIHSPIPHPPFSQSAMDGYAIAHQEGEPKNAFKLLGEIKAGDASNYSLQTGEAVRIFTGAMVPEGTTSIIMQEVTEAIDGLVHIHQEIKTGLNIRPMGEQIQKGDLALTKGTILNPAGIGFLNGLGITEVTIYKKPTVGVIVTGNELVQAGNELQAGQIYESNSSTLISALQSGGVDDVERTVIEDNLEATIQSIQQLIEEKDILILSGGISVGDYDFVGKALKHIGVEEIFYKVKQKPGKPLFYGKNGRCNVFALPGNPSAALTCYYQYVLLAIKRMSGNSNHPLEKRTLQLNASYTKKGDRAQFLKAKVQGHEVEILDGQSSAMLHSFALADALVYIPHDINEVQKGEEVEVHMLP